MNNNGHAHMQVKEALEKLNNTDMEDITIEGVKALFPGMQQTPLFSQHSDTNNPGKILISNEGDLLDYLKVVYIKDFRMANIFAGALAECYEFLLNEDGTVNSEVAQRIESLKNRLALYCSVGGRWADTYKQTVTGVLTNTMSDRGGWEKLQLPIGGKEDQHRNRNGKSSGGKAAKP